MSLPTYTVIAPSAIQANAPLTTDLATDWTDNTEHVRQTVYDPDIHTPQIAHDHDGFNSALISGFSGGANLLFLSEANIATPEFTVNPLSNFRMRPDGLWLWGLPGLKGGVIRAETFPTASTKLNRFDFLLFDTGEVDDILFGCIILDPTGVINANDRIECLGFKNLSGFIDVGIYTGDGVNPQAITGIGFAPDLVIIWAEATQTPQRGVAIRSANMVGTRIFDSGLHTTLFGIDSLDADGFSVEGSSAFNENGVIFGYIAIKAGMNSNGERIDLFNYDGDGNSDRDLLLALGYTPQFAMIVETTTSTTAPAFHSISMGARSIDWKTPASTAGGIVRRFEKGTVIVGDDVSANGAGRSYDILTFLGGVLR